VVAVGVAAEVASGEGVDCWTVTVGGADVAPGTGVGVGVPLSPAEQPLSTSEATSPDTTNAMTDIERIRISNE
jgi:hypothetical protein